MKKIHQLEGHTERVLFLTASPGMRYIVIV